MTTTAKRPVSLKSRKPSTKISKVKDLLSRKSGATLEQLMKTTGWQKHTVRAALTGLRKKGHAIERETLAGKSIYRIVATSR